MSSTDDEAILEAERRLGRPVGATAILSVLATVATVMIAGSVTSGSAAPQGPAGLSDERIDRARHLIDFKDNATALSISTGLRCLGLLLMIGIGIYLYRLVRTRDENAVKPIMFWLAFIAPTLMVLSSVLGFMAYGEVADTLVASGPQSIDRATQLIDDSGGLAIANFGDTISRVVVALWLAFLATAAMRVGLLTRFMGYWGVAGGASLVVLPIGDAMVAAWIASMGILALGFWPGGRPLAWDSTEPQEIEAI